MAARALKEGFSLSAAGEADLESLTTIHARAFHPTNEFQRKAMPDTPTVRNWWYESFKRSLTDTVSRTFIVKEANERENTVIAVIRLKWLDIDEDGSGCWSIDGFTEDHDVEICMSFITPMTAKRKKLMHGRPHYCTGPPFPLQNPRFAFFHEIIRCHRLIFELPVIELFGTDHDYQGTGAGSALLDQCCRLADEKRVAIFVEANGKASTFYTRFGFEIRDELILDLNHRECFMVREPR